MNYEEFINHKRIVSRPSGFEVDEVHSDLFVWQSDIVRWALRMGKAALFEDCGLGKGQPEGAMILTPSGFVANTDLQMGDLIIASDGKAYPLIAKYHRGIQPIYEVAFSDNTSFVVDADHLHIVRTNNDRQRAKDWRVLSTKQLLDSPIRYGENGKSRNYDIPVVAPIEFQSNAHMIDPYLMGAILGDGCITSRATITIAEPEILALVSSRLPSGWTLKKKDSRPYDYSFSPTGNRNDRSLIQDLRRLGILGCDSSKKFIPREYLFDSVDNRLNLLRGLMDTDGYIKESSQFYSVSKRLADDVMFLVRSLGGVPTICVKRSPSFTHKGERKSGQDCYIVTFSLKTFNPFAVKRKADLWNPIPRANGRWIDSIKYCGEGSTICLSVGSPDQSYVTEQFIVTHNTPQQLAWAQKVHEHTNANVLILAPLAVSRQTKREGEKFGIHVTICRNGDDIKPGINIANYERLHLFDPSDFSGIVLDESSILKAQFGTMRRQINQFAKGIPYRLAATATPAPNDLVELINHAEFLGIMSEAEIKALFFTQDGNSSNKFRIKRHAEQEFWKWMASWSVALRKPSDLGYEDNGFILPPLNVHQVSVGLETTDMGTLFAMTALTLDEQRKARNVSLNDRVAVCAEMVNDSQLPWLVWCDLNAESEALKYSIPGAVEVKGSDSPEHKENAMIAFSEGNIRVLVTKPSIAGFGMNWQHCHKSAFVGLSHSYESYYQAVRRVWRFGQRHPVDAYVITSEADGPVVQNINRKEAQAIKMYEEIVRHIAVNTQLTPTTRQEMAYVPNVIMKAPKWANSRTDAPTFDVYANVELMIENIPFQL